MVKEYIILSYENLEEASRKLDIEYKLLEAQWRDAYNKDGTCVYYRRYVTWSWVIISNEVPIDWVMNDVMS